MLDDRSHDLFLWVAAGLIAAALALLGISATVVAAQTQPDQVWWRTPLAFIAYGLLGLAVVSLLGAVRGWTFPGRPSVGPPGPPPSSQAFEEISRERVENIQAEAPEDRIYIDVTPAYLVGLFNDLTDLQAMPLTKPYLGKWMRVSGQLGNVMSGRETISQVTFKKKSLDDPPVEHHTLYMYFDRSEWDERLAVLPPGSPITVVGRLREFDRFDVHLERCELVDG